MMGGSLAGAFLGSAVGAWAMRRDDEDGEALEGLGAILGVGIGAGIGLILGGGIHELTAPQYQAVPPPP